MVDSILMSVLSLGGLGLAFGLGLGYAGIKFRVEEDPKLSAVREALPGVNCGGCGYTGCDAYAQAVVAGAAKTNACTVGGADATQKISEVMGIKAEIKSRETAFVKCAGNSANSKYKYEYVGINNCKMAMLLAGGGSKECAFGCLGCGSCISACGFDAIKIVDGIAIVDKEKCISCGQCVASCPKNLIELVPYDKKVHVMCSSCDNGKIVRAACSVGCIGCKMCAKACEHDAIHINNNIAKIDYEKCTECGECIKKCPMKAIV